MKLRPTLREQKQKKADSIVRSVLEGKYVHLSLEKGLTIEEDVKGSVTKVSYEISLKALDSCENLVIVGEGEGPVDAFFSSLKRALVNHCESLDGLYFREFAIHADIGRFSQNHSGSNSPVEAILVVRNEREEELIFRKKSRSTNKAALSAVLSAMEYFINSEKAVIILKRCIKDARKRNRGDLIAFFTRQLTEIVRSNSYERVLNKKENR